uniref:Uncharacterized protein n=1 Tax=Anguilla anguilla TaxID=7936 RepID=A0A0E9WMX3_ANGAN
MIVLNKMECNVCIITKPVDDSHTVMLQYARITSYLCVILATLNYILKHC